MDRNIQDAHVNNWQQQILLVSPFFYPELISTGRANQHLAEAFAADGYTVTIICSHPLYPAWKPTRSHTRLDGLKIHRGGAWMRYPKAMPLRRLLLEGWFAAYALVRAWRLRKQMDILVSVLPPSLFSFFLHAILPPRVRRVAVIHDLQGVLAAQQESSIRRAIIRLIHAVESRAFRSQDLCIFFSGDMARAAQASYALNSERVAVQYPFITMPQSPPAVSQRLADLFPPERLHVVYSGALGYKQNSQQMVAFLQAAAERHPRVRFHILSGGPFFDELSARYGNGPGAHVHFHPLVAEQDLAEMYARSDIQIIPQAEGTEGAALPSKLPNLMAAGVYLLAICGKDSEAARLVQQAGTGSIVERWDLDLFLARLDEALAIVQRESASARRVRIEPLLPLFSVRHMVRLIVGDFEAPVCMPEIKSESAHEATVQSGVRG